MSTRIGIVSDIHACPGPLAEALEMFSRHHVKTVLCAGDIAGYGDQLEATVNLLTENHCQCILGNHEIWQLEQNKDVSSPATHFFKSLPRSLHLNISGQEIFMVHAEPPDKYTGGIRLLNQNGELNSEQLEYWDDYLKSVDYQVLIVGHTHQVFAEKLGNTLVINPGSSRYNHSCAILTLPDLTTEFFPLSGQPIVESWNWSDEFKT